MSSMDKLRRRLSQIRLPGAFSELEEHEQGQPISPNGARDDSTPPDSGYNTGEYNLSESSVTRSTSNSSLFALNVRFRRQKSSKSDMKKLNRRSLPPSFHMHSPNGSLVDETQSLNPSASTTPTSTRTSSASTPVSPVLSPAMDLSRPMSRRLRRASLSEVGFGRRETYEKLEKLGEGTYATVFKGKSSLTGLPVALKEIRLEHEEGAPCTAIREISLLKDLKHNNIVCLHDIVYNPNSLMLVFEFVTRDLKQYMEACNGLLHMNNIRLFVFQLLRGLAYCHGRKVLHRDLKPQNLLISEAGDLKLADFGLARAKSVPSKTYSNEVVTLWYRPPDVLLGNTDYTGSIDMWGVGCIFLEMITGRPVFPGSNVEDELYLIFKALGTPTEEIWPGISQNEEFLAGSFPRFAAHPLTAIVPRLSQDGASLLGKLLVYNPTNRLSASDAMHHQYFQVLGERVHQLHGSVSIFTIDGITLKPDPGFIPPPDQQETPNGLPARPASGGHSRGSVYL